MFWRTDEENSPFLFFQRHFLKVNLFFTVFYVNDSVVLPKKSAISPRFLQLCDRYFGFSITQKKPTKCFKSGVSPPFYVSLHLVRPREVTPHHKISLT